MPVARQAMLVIYVGVLATPLAAAKGDMLDGAKTLIMGRHGNWESSMVESPDGQSTCLLGSRPSDGARLFIRRTRSAGMAVAVWNEKWEEDDYRYHVEFTFSRSFSITSMASINANHSIIIGLLPDDAESFLSHLKTETAVAFSTRQFQREWSLVGSAEALVDFRMCAQVQDRTR